MLTMKDKVEFLMKERELARQELFIYLKTNHNTLFSYFTISGIFIGLYLGKFEIGLSSRNYVLWILGQIGFIILVFNLNIQCAIGCLAGYMRSLEEKINAYSGDEICQWECLIVKKYFWSLNKKSGVAFSTFIISVIFLLLFLLYTYLMQTLFGEIKFVILHIIEIIILIILARLAILDRKRSYELTKFSLK
jgi:Kef-type K+ transport system membrane component KefB